MKIIDFELRGNQVKFYLGNDNCYDYWGDDWNDRPYEHNAGEVYEEFVRGIKYMTFGFEDVVVEPCDGEYNSFYSKEDMKKRKVPCVCVLKEEYIEDKYFDDSFKNIVGNKNAISYYFGDTMEPDEIILEKPEKKYLHINIDKPTQTEFKLVEIAAKTISSTINAVVYDNRKVKENAEETFKLNTTSNLKKYFNNILKQIQKIYFPNVDVDILSRIKIEVIDEKKYFKSKCNGTTIEDLYIETVGNDIYDIGKISYGRNYELYKE